MSEILKIHDGRNYFPDNYFASEGGNDGYDYGYGEGCNYLIEYANNKTLMIEHDDETYFQWFTTIKERDRKLREELKDAILLYPKITNDDGEEFTDYMQSGGFVVEETIYENDKWTDNPYYLDTLEVKDFLESWIES